MAKPGQDLAGETVAPDEGAVTAEFIAFLQSASTRRYPTGPLLRFNQARHSGCVEGEFVVVNGLDSNLRVGAFSEPRSYPAWIRFASATSASDREKDVRGMSIKLLRVPGENLTPGETSQDFILNSHPVMMVPGTREFLELLRAAEGGTMGKARYFLTHPKAARIAFASREQPSSHLDIQYWSTTPYQFGAGRAVKYIVRPTPHVRARKPNVTDTYLHDALRQRLSIDEASFDFFVQFQIDATRMPIEDASVEWKERESPYLHVARLRIPRQDIDVPGRDRACERMAFNPWHCLAEHRPLGNMNRARREIYEAMSRFRQSRQVG